MSSVIEPGVYLEVSEATALTGKPIQVCITKIDEAGGGFGERLAGPKYGSSGSRLLKRIRIDRRTADALALYLQWALDDSEQHALSPAREPVS